MNRQPPCLSSNETSFPSRFIREIAFQKVRREPVAPNRPLSDLLGRITSQRSVAEATKTSLSFDVFLPDVTLLFLCQSIVLSRQVHEAFPPYTSMLFMRNLQQIKRVGLPSIL